MDISIVVPGIRPEKWVRLYTSFKESFHGSGEMIFISPFDLPKHLWNKEDVRIINSHRCPVGCQQMGHKDALGKYICWLPDDCALLAGSLDIAFNLMKNENFDHETVVMGKYTEGEEGSVDFNRGTKGSAYNPDMEKEVWYHLNYHKDLRDMDVFPNDYLMLNVGLISAQLLREFGGLDCRFETMALAHADLAIRLQNAGLRFIVQEEIFYRGTYLHANQADHGPVHEAMTNHDFPLFKRIYPDLDSLMRTKIDFEVEGEEIWKRRFANE